MKKFKFPWYTGFIVAGLIFVTGMGTIVVHFTHHDVMDKRQLVMAPGTEKVHFHKPGDYAIFYEYHVQKRNLGFIYIENAQKFLDVPALLEIRIWRDSDGQPIPLKEDSSMTYTERDYKGESLYSFKVQHEGVYHIQTTVQESENLQPLSLAIIYDFSGFLIDQLVRMGITLLLTAPFGVLSLIQYWRMNRTKTQQV
ncbi:hypothetical protein [Marinicrinis sediminis]|uniref:DUF3592 domain-containing protein n=1 Tax=Marinicrinis sediminis TaxID=1652465 RepID=A0ABW5RDD5_9BACL